MVAIANDSNFGGGPANKTCRCAPVTLAHHVFLSSAEGAFDSLMTFDFGGVQRRISHVQGASNHHRCYDGSALFRTGRRRSAWRPRALRALKMYAGAYGGSRIPLAEWLCAVHAVWLYAVRMAVWLCAVGIALADGIMAACGTVMADVSMEVAGGPMAWAVAGGRLPSATFGSAVEKRSGAGLALASQARS